MKMLNKTFKNKQSFKRSIGRCQICNDKRYEVLDAHRWRIEGKDGGKYTDDNTVCVCSKCHRLIHAGKIVILGTFSSTAGKLLNYLSEDGIEKFSQY